MVTDEDYQLAEAENVNLRNALAWAAERLSAADRDVLERRLDTPIDDGGVTGTERTDQIADMTALLTKLVAHVEPLLLSPPPTSTRHPVWFARLDTLLSAARGYEPKHPVMRRIGGHPNVFAPAGRIAS